MSVQSRPRRGRRVAAFIVEAAYLALEIVKARLQSILYWNSLPLRQQLRFVFPLMYGSSNVPLPCTSSTARGRRVGVIAAITHQIDRDGCRRGRRGGRRAADAAVDVAADYERLNAYFV